MSNLHNPDCFGLVYNPKWVAWAWSAWRRAWQAVASGDTHQSVLGKGGNIILPAGQIPDPMQQVQRRLN